MNNGHIEKKQVLLPGKSYQDIVNDVNNGHIDKSLIPLPGNNGCGTGEEGFCGHI